MFSKRARYALHGVGFLAYHHPRAPVPFSEILAYLEDYSSEASLSPGYIAKVFQELSRAGVVVTVTGRKGGYALARPPAEVRLLDLVVALDGGPQEGCCLLSVGGCSNQGSCGVNEVIHDAERAFTQFLAAETAASLAAKMFRQRGPLGKPAWTARAAR
jgi:Rrf2 family protein